MLLCYGRERGKKSEVTDEFFIRLKLDDDIKEFAWVSCRCDVDDESMQTIANTSNNIDIDPCIFSRSSERYQEKPYIDGAERNIPVDMKVSSELFERLRKVVESEVKIWLTEEFVSRASFTEYLLKLFLIVHVFEREEK